jgi:hypothetical protein
MTTDHRNASMKFKLFLLQLLTILSLANTCHREGPDCHHGIVIENASSDSVIFALKFYNLTHQNVTHCGLDGEVLQPNSKLDWGGFRTCWENRLSNGKSEEIYFIDPHHFYQGGGFYDCDSIDIKNKVLKHYIFTLDDLKRGNFTIIFK